MQKTIYIIGYGYVGKRIAAELLNRGEIVHAISRTNDAAITHPNFSHHSIDLDRLNDSGPLLRSGCDVIYLAPPPPNGVEETRIKGFFQHLEQHNIKPGRIIYYSATGVYGDCGGEWITEDSPVSPHADRSKRRLDAETQLRHWCQNNTSEWIILRVAGIYGPGRLPLERIKTGMTVLNEKIAPSSNRIHVNDLVDSTIKAMESEFPNEIYNVADDTPTTMTDYFTSIAKVFGLPLPRQVSWEEAQQTMSPQMLSYLSESKRLDNTKLHEKLRVKLRFPGLGDGLRECIGSNE